jgi:hypothetical protein
VKKGQKATKPYKGSIRQLVVNLRCEWCKELFAWEPRYHSDILRRLPRTCTSRCGGRLREWERSLSPQASSRENTIAAQT